MKKTFEYELAGRALKITTGQTCEQSNGSCWVQYGDSVVMVNVNASKGPREGIDFFPLSVEFQEKMYAAGKFPGGFIKREGRPSEKAILTARLIDRPIRPLFPEGYRNDVQVIATPLSVDEDNLPEHMAMIGSSIALSISDIPWNGPTAAVGLGLVDGEYIVNPTAEQRKLSRIDLTVAGTKEAIMMVEAGSKEVSEEEMLKAILTAHEAIKGICTFIEEIATEIGKDTADAEIFKVDDEIMNAVRDYSAEKLREALFTVEKQERNDKIDALRSEVKEHFAEVYPEMEKQIGIAFHDVEKEVVRTMITVDKVRPDHRKLDEIRPISCEAGLLPRTHGSGLFTRGQTQALTITTLGAAGDAQTIDGLGEMEVKRYMHQYNFPPYSVGETGFMRGPGRREIGHGALAERALVPVLPSEEDFPYTIRLVSEVLSSNGSSSQASICGSTLSLLDAGVPIRDSVAGIAMGLIKENEHVAILSDIQGLEDHLGDMDFKVAGTKDGITAIQMDIKIDGIDEAILREALEQARLGRLHILGKMNAVIDTPREELSEYAPRIMTMNIDPDKIREVIGAGGKTITKLIEDCGGQDNIKLDIDNSGLVMIATNDAAAAEKAVSLINAIVKDPEVGEVYTAKVVRIMDFGAFVEFMPGKEGLVHISKIAKERVNKVEDVLSVGDEITVKIIKIDEKGRINLSRKDTLE
ncbi:MAG: polyribonucleotide nucleotidyltransferase [Tissierellales bacterium]|jgi:polyribonucleotide nucleotidyltransferase|nr:polyribonucleotide nucleotidyltransferase [Tissierellales bacterium]